MSPTDWNEYVKGFETKVLASKQITEIQRLWLELLGKYAIQYNPVIKPREHVSAHSMHSQPYYPQLTWTGSQQH